MVQPRGSKINRRNTRRVKSEVDRIGTGIPVSVRGGSNDPPMLPHVVAMPVRIRFHLRHLNSTSLTGYTIGLASTPFGANNVDIYANPTTGVYTAEIGLNYNHVFIAAAMRIFGVNIADNPGGSNALHTDFAIQKCTFYGTDSRRNTTQGIMMTLDFGPDIPGFVGRDSGNANQRAKVSARPPRLSWQKYNPDAAFNFASFNVGPGLRDNTNFSATSQLTPMGVIDFTVIVRRGLVAPSNSTAAAKTVFIDDAGEEIATTTARSR